MTEPPSIAQERPRIAVYTVITGGYDTIIPLLHAEQSEHLDFIVLTDGELDAAGTGYQVRRLEKQFDDPVVASRYPKINSHRVLPEYDITVYLDANLMIVHPDVAAFATAVVAEHPIAQFLHHERNCTYQEAEAVVARQLSDKDLVGQQVSRYRAEGLPEEFGVANNCIIIRRHHDAAVIKASEIWWEEYVGYSKRDQIASEYARWRAGLTINHLLQSGYDNELAIRLTHKKKRRPAGPGLFRLVRKAASAGKSLLQRSLGAADDQLSTKRPWASSFAVSLGVGRRKAERLRYHARIPKFLHPRPRIILLGCSNAFVINNTIEEYPGGRFTFIDANPAALAQAKASCEQQTGCTGEFVEATVAADGGKRHFYQHTDGSLSAYYRHRKGRRVARETQPLVGLLPAGPVHLLQINVSGMEFEALAGLRGRWCNVMNVHLEVHEFPGAPGQLGKLLELLDEEG